jgi:hypothetical protein
MTKSREARKRRSLRVIVRRSTLYRRVNGLTILCKPSHNLMSVNGFLSVMEFTWSSLVGAIGFVAANPTVRLGLRAVFQWLAMNWPRNVVWPGYAVRIVVAASVLLFTSPGLVPATGQMRPTRGTRGRQATANPNSTAGQGLLAKFEGTIRAKTKKEIVLEVEGEQSLTLRLTKKTTYFNGKDKAKPDDVPIGTSVVVEATRELNGDLSAVNVLANQKAAETAVK